MGARVRVGVALAVGGALVLCLGGLLRPPAVAPLVGSPPTPDRASDSAAAPSPRPGAAAGSADDAVAPVEDPLAVGLAIGTVRSALDGHPVAGATVLAWRRDEDRAVVTTTSDLSGGFRLALGPPESDRDGWRATRHVALCATAEGFGACVWEGDDFLPGDPVTLWLEPPQPIDVRLSDDDGAPVGQARVRARTDAGYARLGIPATDADGDEHGRAVLRLAPGAYRIEVRAPGHAPESRWLRVGRGPARLDIHLRRWPPTVLRFRDAAGATLAGATVLLRRIPSRDEWEGLRSLTAMRTGSDGCLTLDDDWADSAEGLGVTAIGLPRSGGPLWAEIHGPGVHDVGPAEPGLEPRFWGPVPHLLEGVFESPEGATGPLALSLRETEEDARAVGRTPGIWASSLWVEEPVPGRFRAVALFDGEAMLVAERAGPDGTRTRGEIRLPLRDEPCDGHRSLRLLLLPSLPEATSVRAHQVRATLVWSDSGLPAVGVRSPLGSGGCSDREGRIAVRVRGERSAAELFPEGLLVIDVPPDGWPAIVPDGGDVDLGVIRVRPRPRLRVAVRRAAGAPIRAGDWQLQITPGDDSPRGGWRGNGAGRTYTPPRTTCDEVRATGRLPDDPSCPIPDRPGRAVLEVEPDGALPVRLELALDGVVARDVEITCPAGTTVRGRLVAPDGHPVAGASVRVDPADPAWAWPGPDGHPRVVGGRVTTTDATGAFEVRDVPAGEFDVYAVHPTLRDGRYEARGRASVAGTLGDLVASPAPVLVGVVVDPEGRPVVGARVGHGYGGPGLSMVAEPWGYRYTATDGRFRFPLAALDDPGDLDVPVCAQGFERRTFKVVRNPDGSYPSVRLALER